MAMSCIHGGKECDGCMACWNEPAPIGECAYCHEPIYAGEDHYDIEGELIHEDHLVDWASKYRQTA